MTCTTTLAMRVKASRGIAAGAMMLAPPGAAAQNAGSLHDAIGAPEALTIRASIRQRTEVLGGQFRPAPAPADEQLWSLRTAVFAEYDTGPVRIGGELRDARGYLQPRASAARTGEINALEPLQAYVAADLGALFPAGSTAALTVGRFTMDVGAQRLVGAPDFPNNIVSFTGARFEWRDAAKNQLMLFWTMPAIRIPFDTDGLRRNRIALDVSNASERFFGADLVKADVASGIGLEAYALRLDERDSSTQPTRDRRLLTYGVRVFRAPAPGAIDLDIEAARQTGEVRATSVATDHTDLAVQAGFVHAEVGRKWSGRWSPRVSVHADYASGDDADPGRYARFDPLFGAPRADFGPTALYGAINRANVVSGGLRIDVAPTRRIDGFVMAQAVWLATATDGFSGTGVRDPAGRSGRYGGSQIEARVRYWIVPQRLRLEGGGAYLAKGRFLRVAPNAPAGGDTRYGYLDISASF